MRIRMSPFVFFVALYLGSLTDVALAEIYRLPAHPAVLNDNSSEVNGNTTKSNEPKACDNWEYLSRIANISELIGLFLTFYVAYKTSHIDKIYVSQNMIPALTGKLKGNIRNLQSAALEKRMQNIRDECSKVNSHLSSLREYNATDAVICGKIDKAITLIGEIQELTASQDAELVSKALSLRTALTGIVTSLDNKLLKWGAMREKK